MCRDKDSGRSREDEVDNIVFASDMIAVYISMRCCVNYTGVDSFLNGRVHDVTSTSGMFPISITHASHKTPK